MKNRKFSVLVALLSMWACAQTEGGGDGDTAPVPDTIGGDAARIEVWDDTTEIQGELQEVSGDTSEVLADVSEVGSDANKQCAEGYVGYPDCVSQALAWYDEANGRLWQVTPPDGDFNWQQAQAYCEALELGGLTDWRLPTISELRSLIRGCPGTMPGGDCAVSDSCLTMSCLAVPWDPCTPDLGPDEGCYWVTELEGFCFLFWSASQVEDYPENAWSVNFNQGGVGYLATDNVDEGVRCVRSLQQ
jgi:hypothetical protein